MKVTKGSSRRESRHVAPTGPILQTKQSKLGIVLICFVIATLLAYLQSPRPNPLKPASLTEQIFSPLEKNGFVRLPTINGQIIDMFVLPNTQQVWAVGTGGLIIHTADGGKTWEQQTYAADINLHAVAFFNATTGLIAGEEETLLKTIDGGKTWIRIPSRGFEKIAALNSLTKFNHLQFIDEKNVVMTANANTILRSADGGDSWIEIYKNDQENIQHLQFSNQNDGWKFDETKKNLMRTEDGGTTWTPVESELSVIHQINVINKEKILLTGIRKKEPIDKNGITNSVIIFSENAGYTWSTLHEYQRLSTTRPMMVSNQSGKSITLHFVHSITQTNNQGKSWQSYLRDVNHWIPDFTLINYIDEKTLVGVDIYNAIQLSNDNGKNWVPITSPLTINSASFIGNNGIAVGTSGTILSTKNSGHSWTPQNLGMQSDINDVELISNSTGITIGSSGAAILSQNSLGNWTEKEIEQDLSNTKDVEKIKGATTLYAVNEENYVKSDDAGKSWKAIYADIVYNAKKVKFFDKYNGLVIGNGANYTTDEGNTWNESNLATNMSEDNKNNLNDVAILNEQTAIAAGQGLYKTTDRGATWKKIKPLENENLDSIAFSSKGVGLVSGTKLWRTDNNGETWSPIGFPNAQLIRGIYFLNERDVFTAGAGLIATSSDSGKTWHTLEYSRYPALWYWVICFCTGIYALWLFARNPETNPHQEQTIADLLASDRPLRPGDPDPLEFGAVARGLSRFMRNTSTEPPLTLAITGAWGTGKSSLMNLLYQDLKKFGFTPVWFNAWHHQKGEQLLASLYANIRAQAIPGWFSFSQFVPIGILFRINLLFRRGVKNWLSALSLLFLFTVAISSLTSHHESIPSFVQEIRTALTEVNSGTTDDSDPISRLLMSLARLLGIGGPALILLRAVTAFGLHPLKLISHSTSSSTTQKIDPSARQQFAREFSDVAKSLSLGRIVIFIDDLDRCTKENVVEILETINFLSVSGDCYIVLGMDESWVKICVTQQFSEMAKDDPEFAEHYLEKMINIKIPVPVMSMDDSKKLLINEMPTPAEERAPLENLFLAFVATMLRYGNLLSILLIVSLGILLGRMVDLNTSSTNAITQTTPSAQLTQQQRILNTSKTTPLKAPIANTIAQEQRTANFAPTNKSTGVSELQPGEKSKSPIPLFLPLIASLLLIIGALRFSMKLPERRPKDSDDFKRALAIWQPWILLNRQTPRSIKRYLNRVRYVAMRFRPETALHTMSLSQSLKRLLQREEIAPDESVPHEHFEANLVALNAIYNVDPTWITDVDKFKSIQSLSIAELIEKKFPLNPEQLKKWTLLLTRSIEEHDEAFGTQTISDEERYRFLEILAEA